MTGGSSANDFRARPGVRLVNTLRTVLSVVLLLVVAGCAGTRDSYVGSRGYHRAGQPYFYDDLSPYGRWVECEPYGWCWSPYDITAGWRPYLNGGWVYTDYGWTWSSDEPWGWAT